MTSSRHMCIFFCFLIGLIRPHLATATGGNPDNWGSRGFVSSSRVHPLRVRQQRTDGSATGMVCEQKRCIWRDQAQRRPTGPVASCSAVATAAADPSATARRPAVSRTSRATRQCGCLRDLQCSTAPTAAISYAAAAGGGSTPQQAAQLVTYSADSSRSRYVH